ncbi:MAG: hypothetical protein PHZ07_02595 [Patescibacteria group bacterium]|nr:hypothetical protein [Patescibacteria group bacterium]MDD4304691.1 hypothetical protein [Patescibacteria group bacterium]MDD4695341.1 hypothetical protein [Patescibacteria group bacterium]
MKHKYLSKQFGFSLIMKIIIVCVLLNVVLLTIVLYSKTNHKNDVGLQNKKGDIQIQKVVNRDKLTKTYKKDLSNLFENFDGNYENLRDQIANLVVPSIDFQNFHLNLVIALTSASEGNNETAKQRLTSIASEEQNAWIKSSLDDIISRL